MDLLFAQSLRVRWNRSSSRFSPALALSQVTTTPDAIKTEFDRIAIRQRWPAAARGCTHMRKAFDIEDINLDDLIVTAMDDPQAMRREQGVSRHQFRRPAHRLPAVLQERDGRRSRRRPRRGHRLLQQGGRRPAGPHQAQGPEAAGRERRARPQGRALRRGLRGEPAARLGAARRHSRPRAEGVHRGRGQALLPAQGHRRARPDPRLHRQSGAVRAPAGRLDHHAAGGEEPPGRRRRHLRAQDARDDRRVAGRAHPEQRRRFWSSISTPSISAAAPGASRWRPAAISASRRSD